MPDEALAALVDEGNLEAVERALREQFVRLPSVLRELDRVLAAGLGNLGAALATLLIGHFHVAQANALADRVLVHSERAGLDELVDLAAALIQQERRAAAQRVLDTALARDPQHARGRYLAARMLARRGRMRDAFEAIRAVPPRLVGPHGMAIQARYALWAGETRAFEGAMKHARRAEDEDARAELAALERLADRIARSGVDPTGALDLRTALGLDVGAALIELAADDPIGRFDDAAPSYGDVGRLVQKLARAVRRLTPSPGEILYATEDGEVVAAGIAQILDRPLRRWRKEISAHEGDWLCMGSAATHPHLPNEEVLSLHAALEGGVLRSLCLVLPVGWRAPIVPDLIGRLTRDDEFPWAFDDEVEDIYAAINDDPPSERPRDDEDALTAWLDRFAPLLRAGAPMPRPPHVPWHDELPLP